MQRFRWRGIDGEIPVKGKGYLLLQETKLNRMAGALWEGAEALLTSGASEIFVTGTGITPVEEKWLHLTKEHDLVWMERSLHHLPAGRGGMTLRPMEQAEGGTFLALYNECFFDVPNSVTYTRNDLERMAEERCMAGFVECNHIPVGIYELKPEEDMPEIRSVGLVKTARGNGMGREMMIQLMERLHVQGNRRCKLLVSTANEPAYRLYASLGFQKKRVESKWYRLRTEEWLKKKEQIAQRKKTETLG